MEQNIDYDDEDYNKDNEKRNLALDRQNESINLLHRLLSSKDGRGVPRDEFPSITKANLRIMALAYYLECKGLINNAEFETYAADFMEWYIDHIANRTSEEYGKYYLDIDSIY